MIDKEREPITSKDVKAESVPTDIEIPPEIERALPVQSVSSQTKGLTDDKGNVLAEPIPTQIKTVNIGLTDEEIEKGGKGNSEDALTWFSRFIKRIKLMAKHFGWRVEDKK